MREAVARGGWSSCASKGFALFIHWSLHEMELLHVSGICNLNICSRVNFREKHHWFLLRSTPKLKKMLSKFGP